MTRITTGVCLVLVLSVGLVPLASTHAETAGDFYRWGIGWDRGLGLRYYVDSTWGFGFRVLALFEWESVNGDESWEVPEFRRSDHVEAGAMVFKQYRLGRWLVFGPFAGFDYNYVERSLSEYAWSIGLRPALVWKKRFMLETRFGLRMSYECRRRVSLTRGLIRRDKVIGREIEAFGGALGPGVIVQFMILF
jgi:hypothetical protein